MMKKREFYYKGVLIIKMENKAPIKTTVKIPISTKIKGTIKDFFRKLSGDQYCCNCKAFFDYEYDYCYTRKKPKPKPFKKVIRTKFVPIDNFDNIFYRIKWVFKKQ